MTTLSLHVLDAALGRPAAGLTVHASVGDVAVELVTDADGRARPEVGLPSGELTLTYATGAWFAAQDRPTFFPHVTVTAELLAGEHHHVALLLSPFAYTTYRGS